MNFIKKYPNGDTYKIRLVELNIDNPYENILVGRMEPEEVIKKDH